MALTIKRNGIDVYIVEKYDNVGRVFECYFLYRYGTNKEFTTALEKSRIPICDRKKLEEYIRAISIRYNSKTVENTHFISSHPK